MIACILAAAVSSACLPAHAQTRAYPEKSVRVIVPAPPGSAPDFLVRLVGQKLAQDWGQALVIDNVVGASGNIGTERVAKAAPDGYTLLFNTIGPIAVNVSLFDKLPYDPLKDLAPISLVAKMPNILTVNPWTPEDFRRLLIDLIMVRNAWAFCKTCACELHYFSWCDKDQMVLSYQKPNDSLLEAKKVEPLGLYEVLLELESDPDLGDLNNRKLEHTWNRVGADGQLQPVKLELRFPEFRLDQWREWKLLLESQVILEAPILSDGSVGDSINISGIEINQCGSGVVSNHEHPLGCEHL